ncbi:MULTISPECIES: transposase [unclassified Candidatus Tisiphia]|uniref:transposase n=1 Tax=unclassified Candidatus Tisiphia TaxID=2996318 RepID=UPI00313E445D
MTREKKKEPYIVVNDKGIILADSTTEHNTGDISQIEPLLIGIRAKDFLGDSGYDGEAVYQLLRKKGMKPVIRPPNHSLSVKLHKPKTERDKAVKYQRKRGYQAWIVKNSYDRRESVENTLFRFKTSFGSKFLSRYQRFE